MNWSIAQARQRFSSLIRAASDQAQPIYNRDKLVAAVIDADSYHLFQSWRKAQQAHSLADAFEEVREICREDGYAIDATERFDRKNPFVDLENEASL